MEIGALALPKILKASSILKGSAVEWTAQDELPIEINLPDSSKFHSVFSCPVLKEPSSANNPPLRISCGHVISREAFSRLSKGSVSKFKCPYCPTECLPGDAIQVFL